MMRVSRGWVTEEVVAQVTRWGTIVVACCGGAGVVVGIDRAVRGQRVAEGLGIVAAVLMVTTVSLCVLLYILVGVADRADDGSGTAADLNGSGARRSAPR